MGRNSWNLFEEEVSDKLIREIADAMVASGMGPGWLSIYSAG
jgi:hypothetical protein